MDAPQRNDADALRAVAVAITSAYTGVPTELIMGKTRGLKEHAEARHVAAYLVHCVFGLTLTETGRVFGRDRCSIRHGVALVEDRRDDPIFDALVVALETQAVRAAAAALPPTAQPRDRA
ncbi:chromosome replication initiator DnaA [Stappia sp. 22II-S9-Z10]|nr:chromosome replication initiator DnaA [Stappia sp. 22II-S9-Z10]